MHRLPTLLLPVVLLVAAGCAIPPAPPPTPTPIPTATIFDPDAPTAPPEVSFPPAETAINLATALAKIGERDPELYDELVPRRDDVAPAPRSYTAQAIAGGGWRITIHHAWGACAPVCEKEFVEILLVSPQGVVIPESSSGDPLDPDARIRPSQRG